MWIFFTFLAVFLWSVVNIADAYLVERNKKIGHPIGSLVIFSSLFAFVAAGLIYLFAGKEFSLSLDNKILLIISGFCNIGWIIFYLYALIDDDVSSVIPWFLTVPLFAYILGYFILGETLATYQILGGSVILLGGVILSIKKNDIEAKYRYHIKWKPIVLMTTASLLVAVWGVLFKFVARDAGFWEASFWEHIGLAIAGVVVLIFVKSYRQGFSSMLRRSGKSILSLNLLSETLTIVGNLLTNYALLLVPVTLVYLVQVSQPAVVFILGLVCTLFFPSIIKENISKRSLIHKGVSILIMTIGAVLLFI